jgi:hypothetical protein
MTGSPVYEVESAFHQIHALANSTAGNDWSLVEASLPGPQMTYTPGFAAVVALEALRSCKANHQARDDLQRCFEAASRPERIIIERPIAPAIAP